MKHLFFLGTLFSGVSSKILCNSKGNSYCKNDYSKGEVNAFQITQIRLEKMNKNVALASFHCFVDKI